MDDKDYWYTTDPDDLWIFDKLILSRKLGYVCGPAGVPPPRKDTYIVRPYSNYRMMSKGAQFMELSPDNHDIVPDGYFWCEVFKGRHRSFDFTFGKQILAVEGFRDDNNRLDRLNPIKPATPVTRIFIALLSFRIFPKESFNTN